MSCVFGYTIGNDVSASAAGRRPIAGCGGPRTPTPSSRWDRGSRPTSISTAWKPSIKVNGKETGRFKTNDMIFGIVPFLVELTKYFTLWPGDVIWMGTDGASPDLKAGDVVEIDITGIGTLRNKFVAETPTRS